MRKNYIDTHFHLDFYKNHKELYKYINDLQQYTLCVTNSPGIFLSCKKMYPETKYLKFALGFHPHEGNLTENDFVHFVNLIDETNYVGEIGLDFTKDNPVSFDFQVDYFEKIVSLCSEKNKLMSVHIRKGESEAIQILSKYRPSRCIIHWFNGDRASLEQLIDLGCYFSINGSMLEREAKWNLLRKIPLDRILIESDGPFGRIRGKKFSVTELGEIYTLAERCFCNNDLINIVYENFKSLLLK